VKEARLKPKTLATSWLWQT